MRACVVLVELNQGTKKHMYLSSHCKNFLLDIICCMEFVHVNRHVELLIDP